MIYEDDSKKLERIRNIERQLKESRDWIAGHGYTCGCDQCRKEVWRQLKLMQELHQLVWGDERR